MRLITNNQGDVLDNNPVFNDPSTKLGNIITANKAVAQADSTASTVAATVADLNTLLAKLRTAGILST